MRSFSLLIKPAGADCNLRCDYCFYLPKGSLYPETARHRMGPEVLERLAASYLATEQPQHVFGWQGGEPLLMGVEFFREVTRLQVKHGRAGTVVANGVQTNAVLVDDEMAAHLAAYRFLVGVSLDGPPELHDAYRHTVSGGPTHEQVLRGLVALRRHGVEHNALALVSQANVRHAGRVYDYLLEQGLSYHQYIPCVEFDARGGRRPCAVGGEEWGAFLCALYDRWSAGDVGRVSVRLFDTLLAYLVEGSRQACTMGRDCRQYLVVEHNGDVYPCDFFVEAELRLGNVLTAGWGEVLASPVYRHFGQQKAQWHERCAQCEWLELCAGDCLKHRFAGQADPRQLSVLCAGWRAFYAHALPGLRRIAEGVKAERALRTVTAKPEPGAAVGRNDPCPCGSGRKYKRCCGASRG